MRVAVSAVTFVQVGVAGPVPGMVEAGNFRAIAQAAAEPNARIPRVPLARATKGFEDYNFSIWIGLQAGVKVPDAAVNTLHKAAYAALANPEFDYVVQVWSSRGATLYTSRPPGLVEPLPPVLPNHWELGLSDLGETTDLH